MGKIDEAVKLAIDIARDDSHGYSQQNRTGPDYDCSSLIIHIWDSIGVNVSSRGATYTGNMAQAFLQAGFRKVNPAVESLQPGDVLLNIQHHTALYIGDGKIVQAAIAENGTVHGLPGDQTGGPDGLRGEIGIYPYYDYPWDLILRYSPGTNPEISYRDDRCKETQMPMLQHGDWGPAVAAMQGALMYHGFMTNQKPSGMFDTGTETYLLAFQRKHGLEIDGICGPKTWNELCYWR